MAFEFIGVEQYSTSSSTPTCNKPTGTTDGDIMFAFTVSNSRFTTIPTGRTSLGFTLSSYYFELFYKIASSEGTNYTWSGAGYGSHKIVIVTYRGGFNSVNPIDVVSNTQYITSDVNLRAASMNVTKINSPLVFIGGIRNTSYIITYTKPSIPDTNWVENYDAGDTNSDVSVEVCSMVRTSNGNTGTINAVGTNGSNTKHAFAVALNPAATGNPGAFFQMF